MRRSLALTTMCLSTILFAVSLMAQTRAPRKAPGLDGIFLELAERLPGFGGYFFDANGDLNVFLIDSSRAPEARTLFADVAHNRAQRWRDPWPRPAEIIIRPGTYDFIALDNIRTRLATDLGLNNGVSLFDTDEANNQVFVGVATEEARQHVLSRVAALGLPPNAVSVDIVAPGEPLTTLSDYVRPVVGGLKIEYTDIHNVVSQCTLGVNVWYGNPEHGVPAGTPGFYTASHCSRVHANMSSDNPPVWTGASDSTVYSQGGTRVGYEMYDPGTFRHAQDTNCLESYPQCRYSDVTFAAYDAGVSRNQGYLEETLFPGIGPGNRGSVDLSGSLFTITSTVQPIYGMTLQKVGWTSGWTEGNVNRTCIDQQNGISGIVIVCSYEVRATADNGDSGSPVFYLSGSDNVAFSGIAWYKTSVGSYLYSAVSEIARDMGNGVNYKTY